MPADKSLTSNTSAFNRHRNFGYINSEKNFPLADGMAKQLRLENQALIFGFRR